MKARKQTNPKPCEKFESSVLLLRKIKKYIYKKISAGLLLPLSGKSNGLKLVKSCKLERKKKTTTEGKRERWYLFIYLFKRLTDLWQS